MRELDRRGGRLVQHADRGEAGAAEGFEREPALARRRVGRDGHHRLDRAVRAHAGHVRVRDDRGAQLREKRRHERERGDAGQARHRRIGGERRGRALDRLDRVIGLARGERARGIPADDELAADDCRDAWHVPARLVAIVERGDRIAGHRARPRPRCAWCRSRCRVAAPSWTGTLTSSSAAARRHLALELGELVLDRGRRARLARRRAAAAARGGARLRGRSRPRSCRSALRFIASSASSIRRRRDRRRRCFDVVVAPARRAARRRWALRRRIGDRLAHALQLAQLGLQRRELREHAGIRARSASARARAARPRRRSRPSPARTARRTRCARPPSIASSRRRAA